MQWSPCVDFKLRLNTLIEKIDSKKYCIMIIKPNIIKAFLGLSLAFSTVILFFYVSDNSAVENIGNAYVSGRIVEFETDKSGTLKDVLLKRGARFSSGDILFSFDDTQDQLIVERQQSKLRRIIRETTSRCLSIDTLSKDIQRRKIQSELSQNKLKRYRHLELKKGLSEDALDEFDAQAKLDKLIEEAFDLRYRRDRFLVGHSVMDDVAVVEALVELKNAVYELSRNKVYAPFSGYAYEVYGFAGLTVKPSKALALIVPDETIFVEANILETRLKSIKVGQQAKIYSDIYGKEVEFEGVVHSIVPATAGIFSSLPRNNVDSNWIKVNQRVPVLIQLNNQDSLALPLGTSVKVGVDLVPMDIHADELKVIPFNQAGNNWQDSSWEQTYQQMIKRLMEEEAQRLKMLAGNTDCVVTESALMIAQ